MQKKHERGKLQSQKQTDALSAIRRTAGERSSLNVQFKSCAGTYEQEFSRMVDDGIVSLRGLKVDAKIFDELVFDVNSAYFESHGGYEYAKEFFAETYRLAVKEAVKQVSHSKKWPRFTDEQGHWVNSYSLLQDRFFEHMRAAGFTDFERGERGSTAGHLSVLDYKIQQDEARPVLPGLPARKGKGFIE